MKICKSDIFNKTFYILKTTYISGGDNKTEYVKVSAPSKEELAEKLYDLAKYIVDFKSEISSSKEYFKVMHFKVNISDKPITLCLLDYYVHNLAENSILTEKEFLNKMSV